MFQDRTLRVLIIVSLLPLAAALTSCDTVGGVPANGTPPVGSGSVSGVGQVGNLRADCQSAQTARVNNPLQDGILPHMLKLTHYPPILLFNGTGASPGDVTAIEAILRGNHLTFSTANSARLNEMRESEIRAYRLLIIPGGNFVDIGNSLNSATTTNIRSAVGNGLNYLGICAGAFFAGNSPYNGLNLTSGIRFGFYSAENRGIRKAAVPIAVPSGPTLDQYWEDGPQLTGWGAVIGKYPDGTPAIVQGTFGSGWVILSGIHPEAPAGWRRGMTFTTPASVDNAYAATLIQAALNRTSLAHY